MAATRTPAAGSTLAIIGGAFFAATLLLGTCVPSQAADTADRFSPPSPSEITMLRNLLALQHPSLKGAAPAPVSTTPALMPAVTSEPAPHDAITPAVTEGEVDARPASSRVSRLDMNFRASLDRAMAAAGFAQDKL